MQFNIIKLKEYFKIILFFGVENLRYLSQFGQDNSLKNLSHFNSVDFSLQSKPMKRNLAT